MKPALALLFGSALIAWMFVMDRQWRRLPSRALWVPAIFLAMASSRQLSFWLYQLGLAGPQASRLEGSPVNVVFNSTLFLAAILVLHRRGFDWLGFLRRNKALSLMYAYFLCSALWSPFPVPTLKRVVQDFGCVLTALVILTENNPAAAMRVVFVRVSFILFTLSVVFIRWFPEIGRFVSSVSGAYLPSGVTVHKNELGQLAVVFCLVLVWDLWEAWRRGRASEAQPQRWVRGLNLGIGAYLLGISSSATSWLAFVIGLPMFLLGSRLARSGATRLFATGVLSTIVLVTIGQLYASQFSERMDRGAGLSGRTDIWEVTLEKFGEHYGLSMLGAGYRGFWESSLGESVWKQLGTNPLIQSHNGYLETYLNGGLIGLGLLTMLLLTFAWNAARGLVDRRPLGRWGVVFWPILLFVNLTEAQFFQVGPLWFTTLLVVMNGPTPVRHGEARAEPPMREGEVRAPAVSRRRPRILKTLAQRPHPQPTAPAAVDGRLRIR